MSLKVTSLQIKQKEGLDDIDSDISKNKEDKMS